MTKQEAIDLLDNLIGMIEDNHGSDYDSAIRMAIDALESKWIPCSEMLPEYEEYVRVTFIDKSAIDTMVMCVRRIEGIGDWYWSDFADEYTWEASEVVAWMPLPEPYKEEQHE